MNASIEGEQEPEQTWFQRWRAVLISGGLILLGVGAWMLQTRSMANAPVVSPYVEVIQAYYVKSPKAKQRLDEYYAKYERDTVATKHYVHLCYELSIVAYQDGIKNADIPLPGDGVCPNLGWFYGEAP